MTLVEQGMDSALESLSEQVQMLVEEAEERRQLRERISDLSSDLGPIATQSLQSISRALAVAEDRGYLDMARGGVGLIDRVATSFEREDFDALGDNVVLILETVKEMTQPEIMQMMRSTFHNVGEAEPPRGTPSLFALWRALREAETRRGMARLIVFLRSLGIADTNTGKEAL